MENLSLKIQGVRGGHSQYVEKIGYGTLFIGGLSDNRITIDNFEGYGDSYKQREEPQIEIIENGCAVFLGTIKELGDILRKNNESK